MRKYIAFLVLVLLSVGASAQISSVTKKAAIQEVASFRAGLCSLCYSEGAYFIFLSSTNRFDDPFILYLGDGDQAASKTLEDLIALHKEMKKGETAEFNTLAHTTTHPYKVYKSDRWAFHFMNDHYAGVVAITAGEMKDLQQLFVFH